MPENKKRLLFVNEASFLFTGYSLYGRELLSRLHATGKYDIAELACYSKYDNPQLQQFPWTIYSNFPTNEKEEQEYNSNPINQFGAWRFEEVVLDWKPDCIFAIRDHWMDSILIESPLRPYYNLVLMPTVDSAPQGESWVNTYMDCDGILNYEDFGIKTLKAQAGNKINIQGLAPPCVNTKVFHPIINRKELRKNYLIPDDAIIIGTVMRNQKRKLFPDLINAFKIFLDQNLNIRHKCFLYLHTSYPDLGWDIPRLIKESDISNNILFTYVCSKCKHVHTNFYRDSKTLCPKCKQLSCSLPNTQNGVSEEKLCEIYNLFDCYIQYSIAEGAGIPQLEAGACGIPIMSVDYSAMSDIVRKLNGYPIKVEREFRESETHTIRVYPSNLHLAEILTKFCNLPPSLRAKKGRDALLGIQKHYLWDYTVQSWMKYFDSVIPKNLWNSPPKLFTPNSNPPEGMSPSQIVNWAIINVLGQPEKLNSFFALRLVRDLNYGASQIVYGGNYINEDSMIGAQPRYKQFNPKILFDHLYDMRNKINYWEKRRCGIIKEEVKPIIRFAKREEL